MENAEIIFKLLLSNKKKETDRMIDELESEHGLFDFKCKSNNDESLDLDKYDRKNFSKALSGFANAAGGLLIWGINKKNKKKGKYQLIKNPERFIENLNIAIAELAMPFVEGVHNKLIFKDKNKGLVVTYIPESDKTPHMAMPEKLYYKRIGDSFRILEHRDVEDMFGRRSRPKLTLDLKAKQTVQSKSEATYSLSIGINNEGKAISQNYGFDFEFITKLLKSDVNNPPKREKGLTVHNSNSGIGIVKYRVPKNSPVKAI